MNERDNLGDDLVPDYITAVQEAAFYGWPYAYYGQNIDPRRKGERPELVSRSVKPDYSRVAYRFAEIVVLYGRQLPRQVSRYNPKLWMGGMREAAYPSA